MFPHLIGRKGPGAAIVVGGGSGDGDGGFVEPPVVTTTASGNTTITGKVKPGSFGKFVYPLATIVASRVYTFRTVANFSQLALQGKLAMVGVGVKNGNDFHLDGLRGDGSTGCTVYEVYGTAPNGWNKQTGHSVLDSGAPAHGTQYTSYHRLTTSVDGTTVDYATSADGVTYVEELSNASLTPFTNVSGVVTFGVALWFNNTDAGPFSIVIDQFADILDDPVGVTFVAHAETANDATPNYTSLSFGPAASDRVMVAFEAYTDTSSGSSDFTGTTIGGVSATEVTEATGSGSVNAGMHVAAVPSGTTGNIDIGISNAGALTDSALSLLRMKGFSATPYAVNQGLTGGTSISRTIDCPAGGVIVAGCYNDGGAPMTWTNVDELDDFLWDSNQKVVTTAARVYASAQTGLSISAARTSGVGVISLYMVVASFAPL